MVDYKETPAPETWSQFLKQDLQDKAYKPKRSSQQQKLGTRMWIPGFLKATKHEALKKLNWS